MKWFLISLLVMLTLGNIQAQDLNTNSKNIGIGAAGLIGIGEGAYLGGTFSLKYLYNDHSQFRVGFEGFNSFPDGVNQFEFYGVLKQLNKETSYGGFLHYLYYFNSEKPVKPYIGGGPVFGKIKHEYTYYHGKDWDPPEGDYWINYDRWYVGITAKFGVEWIISDSFGMMFEYTLTGMVLEGDYEEYYVTRSEVNSYYDDNNFLQVEYEYRVVEESGTESTWTMRGNQFVVGVNFYL